VLSKAARQTLQSWCSEIDLDAAAVAAYHAETDFPIIQALICDDAPQFNWLTRWMILCWVHEGRLYKKLTPVVPLHRQQLDVFLKHFGAHRQFVFAPESCFRLPELSLLAGSIQTYLAATWPPIPTGFWDRAPKCTPGRLRTWLARTTFSDLLPLVPGRIRKKPSVTIHLPKGIHAHRRSKRPVFI
jgi:hypothetical protein